jgi:hypothetical protein
MSTHRPRPSRVFHLQKGFVVFNGLQCCPFCNKQFSGGPQLCGHLAYCKAARETLTEADEMPSDRDPILVMDEGIYNEYLFNLNVDRVDEHDADAAEELDGQWNHYLDLQRLYLSKEEVEFRTGFCLTVQGTWKKANWRNYVAVCKTFEQLTYLTAGEADSVLDLIKFICKDSLGDLALPSEYRKMIKTVLAST